jgi:hypothetical protein
VWGVVCSVVWLLSEDLTEFEHGLALGRALGRTKAIIVDSRDKLLCGGQQGRAHSVQSGARRQKGSNVFVHLLCQNKKTH